MKTKSVNTTTLLSGIITIVFALTSSITFAQENKTAGNKLCGGFGYLTASGEQLNINQLNKALAASGYGQLSNSAASFGGGGAFAVHNLIFGGGGAWLMGSGNQNGYNTVNIKGGYGFFNVGYILYSGKHSLFYPTLGIGGGGYDINISQRNTSSDFNEQLNTPSGQLSAQAGGYMTNIQLSYQYFFSKSQLQGFYIGLKAGYKYSPIKWNISVNDQALRNAPNINMDGLLITLFFGGGNLFKN